jgi:hypothetical protein
MPDDTLYQTPSLVLCAILVVLLFAALELGYRRGRRRRERGEPARSNPGALETAVFGMFGLLVALTFAFVVSRAENRRRELVEETNAIGTAYLRCDLAPEPLRTELRAAMRDYVGQRVALATAGDDPARELAAAQGATDLQTKLWGAALTPARDPAEPRAYTLLLESLNQMFNAQVARDAAMRAHLAPAVLLFLALTATVAALVAGYDLGLAAERHWLAASSFVVMTVLITYTIIDLDRPQRGLFRAPTALLTQLERQLDAGKP